MQSLEVSGAVRPL